MTIVVEDGTGTNQLANTYSSLEEANVYHAAFGNQGWLDFSDEEKEILLLRSSRDLDILYGSRFDSTLLSASSQQLLWPRVSYVNGFGYTIAGLPSQVKAATAELALILGTLNEGDPLAGSLLDVGDATDNIQSQSQSIDGVGSQSTTYFGPRGGNWDKLSRVTLLLRPLFSFYNVNGHYARVARG